MIWGLSTFYILLVSTQNDMFDLLFDCRHHPEQFQDLKPGQMYGTWTLIWNELYDECSHSLPYNPCKEFLMT